MKPIIIIDPGHGGRDPGASANGMVEKDLNLQISLYQYQRFIALGIPVSLTRGNDMSLNETNRTNIVKTSGAKYCLCNHNNAGGGDGFEIIYSVFSKPTLENIIAAELKAAGQNMRSNGVYTKKSTQYPGRDYYYMHRDTGAVHTTIIEYGFIDSKLDDVNQLKTKLLQFAEAPVKAFCTFMGYKYTAPGQTTSPATPGAATPANKYRQIRKYNSDIYIYETTPEDKVTIDVGVPYVREPLSRLIKNNKYPNEKAAANGGFFDMVASGGVQHYGTLIIDGGYWSPPIPGFIDFIYYKDGHTEVRNIKDQAECARLQGVTNWAVGTSYSLVIDGKIDIRCAENFDHSSQRHPRTMLGQKANGTFVLVVVDGRRIGSTGINAKEQAQLMLELGVKNACNFDGGGSSEMIVGGQIKNKPSDGRERSIGSAILVL